MPPIASKQSLRPKFFYSNPKNPYVIISSNNNQTSDCFRSSWSHPPDNNNFFPQHHLVRHQPARANLRGRSFKPRTCLKCHVCIADKVLHHAKTAEGHTVFCVVVGWWPSIPFCFSEPSAGPMLLAWLGFGLAFWLWLSCVVPRAACCLVGHPCFVCG